MTPAKLLRELICLTDRIMTAYELVDCLASSEVEDLTDTEDEILGTFLCDTRDRLERLHESAELLLSHMLDPDDDPDDDEEDPIVPTPDLALFQART